MEKLTKSEEEVLRLIWQKGETTVSQLVATYDDPKPATTTISSFVRILEKKGYLDHKAYGRTHVYFPIIKKEAYSKQKVRYLISDFFEGSIDNLVSFLVKEEELGVSDIQDMIDQIKNDKS